MNNSAELNIQILLNDYLIFEELTERIDDLISNYILEDNVENDIIRKLSDDKVEYDFFFWAI
jgi:hypothetical protein